MSEHLDRLGRQLDAIELAIARADTEPDPEQRVHILAVANRAAAAARTDYDEAVEAAKKRPALRIIKGGAVAAAATTGAGWVRDAWRHHPQAASASALVTAAALTAAVVYASVDNTSTPSQSAAPPSIVIPAPASPGWPSLPPGVLPSPTPSSANSPTGAPPTGPSTGPEAPPPTSPSSTPASSTTVSVTPKPTSSPAPTAAPTSSPTPTVTATAGPPPESPDRGVCLGLRLRPVLDAGSCADLARSST